MRTIRRASCTALLIAIGAIRVAIGEQYWQPTGRGSVRIVRGKMIISQTRLGFKLLGRALSRR